MQAAAKGSSLMQPLRPKSGAPSLGALGSAAFAALARADVAPDTQFFQKYQVRGRWGVFHILTDVQLCCSCWRASLASIAVSAMGQARWSWP